MKNKHKIAAGSLGGTMAAGAALTLILGRMIYKATLGAGPAGGGGDLEAKAWEERPEGMDRLKAYPQQKFMVESPKNGYQVETLHVKSLLDSPDAIILVHGHRSHYYDLVEVALSYLEKGFNVMLYNQRHSGLTGGRNYTFGLFERFDLNEIAVIARRLYPAGRLGVHGFSMGAATAAMQAELNEVSNLVDYYILDSPYHNLDNAVQLGLLEKKYPSLATPYLKWSGRVFAFLKDGIRYGDVSPLEAASKVSVPVMLIHGRRDVVTSPEGSQAIYDRLSHPGKSLVYFEERGHCTAHHQERGRYFQEVFDFIATVNK